MMILRNKMVKKIIMFAMIALVGVTTLGFSTVNTEAVTGLTAVKNSDGTITVKMLSVYENLTMFDFGLLYDNTKITPVTYKFNSNFKDEYSYHPYYGIYACGNLGTYLVFGGVCDDTFRPCDSYLGQVFEATFKVIGSKPGTVKLVRDSAKYNKDFTNAVIEKSVNLDLL